MGQRSLVAKIFLELAHGVTTMYVPFPVYDRAAIFSTVEVITQ